jgi:hypothetical protein
LETIPYTVQRLSALSDITKRIELQVEDFPEDGLENKLTDQPISVLPGI